MSYNKYFFNLNNPSKAGKVLGNFNNKLDFSNQLLVLNNSNLVLTSSNVNFDITGNLYLKNKLTSSYLNTQEISFDSLNNTKINTSNQNKINFIGNLESTGSVHSLNKIVSQEITGSITEIAEGVPLIIGQGGINARKLVSNGKHYYEIFKGDSVSGGSTSPATAAITINVGNGNASFTSPALPDLPSQALVTNGNLHTLKLHEYWREGGIFQSESLIIFCNFMAAGNNDNIAIDFRWTGDGGLGSRNEFFVGNRVKIYYLFEETSYDANGRPLPPTRPNQVFLDFENQVAGSGNITHKITAGENFSEDIIEAEINVRQRFIRASSNNNASDDLVFIGKLPIVTSETYQVSVKGVIKTKRRLVGDYNHNTNGWDFF